MTNEKLTEAIAGVLAIEIHRYHTYLDKMQWGRSYNLIQEKNESVERIKEQLAIMEMFLTDWQFTDLENLALPSEEEIEKGYYVSDKTDITSEIFRILNDA